MKKNYENNQLLFSLIFILMFGYLVLVYMLCNSYYTKYILIDGKVSGKDLVEVVIDSHELKYLKANKYIYINDKKKEKEVVEINRNILKEDGVYYHQVKLKINLKHKYKDFDNIVLRVKEKNEKLYKIFRACWKEM